MVGSVANIAWPNFILNTIVAEVLEGFANDLEKAKDFNKALNKLLTETIKNHKRIIFSGNNYSKEWEEEAERRGLYNLKTTVDALPLYTEERNVKLFARHGVLSESEAHSRKEILLENYANTVRIEALTALDIARKEITPAIIGYQSFVSNALINKKKIGKLNCDMEIGLLNKISSLAGKFNELTLKLERDINKFDKNSPTFDKALYCKDVFLTDMKELRKYADEIELILGKDFNPYPSYEDILYSVKY